MTNRTDLLSQFPFDVRTLWDINGKSFNYAEKAYRAWLDAAGEIQSETVDFMNTRFAKDSAALARFGQCQTTAEMLNAQAEYAQHALADFLSQSQKIAARLGDVAKQAVFTGPAQEAPHRTRHRSGTH